MIGRRGILGMLASAPITAPMAAQSAVPGETGMNQIGIMNQRDAHGDAANALYELLIRKASKGHQWAPPPEHIASKKSWSGAFKAMAARKEAEEQHKLRQQIEALMYGGRNGLDRLLALQDLAKRLDVLK